MTGLHILFLAIKELWTFVNFITQEILPGWYAYVASYLEVFQINVSHFTARLWLLFTTSNFKEIIRWREATQAMLKVYFRTVKNHNQNLKLERFRKIENRRSYSRLTGKTHDNKHEDTGENTDIHCVKSVHIQSFSSLYFPAFRLFVFSPNVGKYEPEKLIIRTRFMQWLLSRWKNFGNKGLLIFDSNKTVNRFSF